MATCSSCRRPVAVARATCLYCGAPLPPEDLAAALSAAAQATAQAGPGRASGGPAGARPAGGVERLRPLRLTHLRADLRLEAAGWEAALERAVANARALDVPLELALFLPDEVAQHRVDADVVIGRLARRVPHENADGQAHLRAGQPDAAVGDELHLGTFQR